MKASQGCENEVAAERERCLKCLEMHRRDMEDFDRQIQAGKPATPFGPAGVWNRVCNMIRSGNPPLTMEEQFFDEEED